jgi:hypothetical protein
LLLLQEQQALHYELNKTIAHQHRVSLRQVELLEDQKVKVAALEKKLEEKQGLIPGAGFPLNFPTYSRYMIY